MDLIERLAAIDALITQANHDGAYGYIDVKEAEDVLMALPTVSPRWIPVTERLPEYGIEVVTVDKDGDYEINHIIDKEDGKWYWRGTIAWMPLPEPWKGADDAEIH